MSRRSRGLGPRQRAGRENKVRSGDVFAIPIGDGRVGIGQATVEYHSEFYYAIFEVVLPEEEAEARLDEALRSPILLLALAMDGVIDQGEWRVLGRYPLRPDLPLPAVKEFVLSENHLRVDVVDYSGTRRRAATPQEAELLPFRRTIPPVCFLHGLRAHLELGPWTEDLESMRPRGMTSREAFPDSAGVEPPPVGGQGPRGRPSSASESVAEAVVGLLARLAGGRFGRRPDQDQEVVVHIGLSGGDFGTPAERRAVRTLCDTLTAKVEARRAGECDASEFGAGEGVLYFRGRNAERLFALIEPDLRSFPGRPVFVVLDEGSPSESSVRERRIDL